MHCTHCNEVNADTAQLCKNCGRSLSTGTPGGASSSFFTTYKIVILVMLGGVLLFVSYIILFQNNSDSTAPSLMTGAADHKYNPDNLYDNNGNLIIPNEVQAFFGKYNGIYGRYGDEYTVLTYYSEKDLEEKYGRSFILNDMSPEATDNLFSKCDTFSNVEVSKENAIEIFNSCIRVAITDYLNYAAKNPTNRQIIDSKFKETYSSADTDDAQAFKNLINFLQSISKSYGSNANYLVEKIDKNNLSNETLDSQEQKWVGTLTQIGIYVDIYGVEGPANGYSGTKPFGPIPFYMHTDSGHISIGIIE